MEHCNENCDTCIYSYSDGHLDRFNDMLQSHNINTPEIFKCNNVNSPYFDEVVDENDTCRLYEYYNQVLVNRKDKLDKLNGNRQKR